MNPERPRQNRAQPPRSQGRAVSESPWTPPSHSFNAAFEGVLQ
jgi:hypothetical protein